MTYWQHSTPHQPNRREVAIVTSGEEVAVLAIEAVNF